MRAALIALSLLFISSSAQAAGSSNPEEDHARPPANGGACDLRAVRAKVAELNALLDRLEGAQRSQKASPTKKRVYTRRN
jgi:hypothetical protein